MLTYHQWLPVTFIWWQSKKRYLSHYSLKLAWLKRFHSNLPGANELIHTSVGCISITFWKPWINFLQSPLCVKIYLVALNVWVTKTPLNRWGCINVAPCTSILCIHRLEPWKPIIICRKYGNKTMITNIPHLLFDAPFSSLCYPRAPYTENISFSTD